LSGTLCLALACFACATSPVWAATKQPRDRQQALEALRQRVEALQKELAASEENRGEAADALKESERAISEANRRLYELAAGRREAEGELSTLNAEIERLRQSMAGQRAEMDKLLLQQYQGGRYEPFRLLLSGQDPQTVSRLLYYYRVLASARADALQALQAALAENKSLAARQAAKQDEIAGIEAEARKEAAALEGDRAERAKTLARIAQQASQQRKELATLQADEKRLARLVERLAKLNESGQRDRAERRGSADPGAAVADTAFGRLKGHLVLPVRGELANRFGSPRTDGGAMWKGLFIRCPGGREVHAVAPGRVVFADWLRGFGNLLIIDHDDGFMSLYGNNEALLREVGATVQGGEVVAQAGNSGGNPESGVYFELRFQGRAFDPLSWLAK
jgi:septal ring factor EnvC (AmiA/AmiB activator)